MNFDEPFKKPGSDDMMMPLLPQQGNRGPTFVEQPPSQVDTQITYIPTPPASGNYRLVSTDGVLSWQDQACDIECPPETGDYVLTAQDGVSTWEEIQECP